MNEFALIKETFAEVHRLFSWAPDDETFGEPEHWSSFADKVEQSKHFRGDCDNFALTVIDLLLRRGVKPENCRLALCWTETNEYHAVAIVHGWLLDNRMRTLRPWATVPYRWHKSMRMDEPGVWRDAS